MTQFESKRLKSGTELPLLNLKGKPYLQVAHRLVWFREEHPNASILTEIVNELSERDVMATVKATIVDENNRILAQAHKQENKSHFPDFLEKAETGSIGRALAMCGYGTQFAPEFDEEDRIVDSPVTTINHKNKKEDLSVLIAKIQSGREKLAGDKIMSLQETQDLLTYTFDTIKVEDLTQEQAEDYLKVLRNAYTNTMKGKKV